MEKAEDIQFSPVKYNFYIFSQLGDCGALFMGQCGLDLSHSSIKIVYRGYLLYNMTLICRYSLGCNVSSTVSGSL